MSVELRPTRSMLDRFQNDAFIKHDSLKQSMCDRNRTARLFDTSQDCIDYYRRVCVLVKRVVEIDIEKGVQPAKYIIDVYGLDAKGASFDRQFNKWIPSRIKNEFVSTKYFENKESCYILDMQAKLESISNDQPEKELSREQEFTRKEERERKEAVARRRAELEKSIASIAKGFDIGDDDRSIEFP